MIAEIQAKPETRLTFSQSVNKMVERALDLMELPQGLAENILSCSFLCWFQPS